MVSEPEITPSEGLRARKQRHTRARISEAALNLFLKHGFDETTLDAIADAAEISRRTFFHYFDSKEAVLAAVDEDVEGAFRVALAASSNPSPLGAVQEALTALISRYASEEAIAMDRLMRSTESLRARKQANYERQERALFGALQAKFPNPKGAGELRAVAMIGIGAMRVASEHWSAAGGAASLSEQLAFVLSDVRSAFG